MGADETEEEGGRREGCESGSGEHKLTCTLTYVQDCVCIFVPCQIVRGGGMQKNEEMRIKNDKHYQSGLN